jgi:hypothetical protein
MPTLPAAGYPYQQVPSETPQIQVPNAYQDIQSPPEAFGAGSGRALEGLGTGFEQAGNRLATQAIARQELYNKVATDDQVNKFEAEMQNVLHGDPSKPGNVGFFGKHGEEAMRAFPQVHADLNALREKYKGGLESPITQHMFDNDTRRTVNYMLGQVGAHYDSETKQYQVNTAKAKGMLGEQSQASAAANLDYPGFILGLEKRLKASDDEIDAKPGGGGEEQKLAGHARIRADSVKQWTDSLAVKNPVAALEFLHQNSDAVDKLEYPQLEAQLRARAGTMQAMIDTGKMPAPPGWTGQKISATAIDVPQQFKGIIASAAQQNGVPEGLLTRVLHAENGFKTEGVSLKGARGIAQFMPDTAAERGINPDDPNSAIPGAAKYLKELHDKTGSWAGALQGYLGGDPNKSKSYNDSGAIQLAHQLDSGSSVIELQGGATRNLPVAEQTKAWLNAGAVAAGDVSVEVFSGGQPSSGTNRVGSHRHDHGGAADVQLRDNKTGQLLDMRKPEDQARMQAFITGAAAAGATGIGAHPDYMGPNGIHVGGGPAAVWGSDLTAATAPEWVRVGFTAGKTSGKGQVISGVTPIPPPPGDAQLPDSVIPGLKEKLDGYRKEFANDPARMENAINMARSDANKDYADAQHAYRIVQEQKKAVSEAKMAELQGRMKSDSPNYPTTDEVADLTRQGILSPEAGRTAIGFIERQTKPDPASAVSARTRRLLFERIHLPDDNEKKLTDDREINDAYIRQDLTEPDRKGLIADFKEANNESDKHIATQKARLFQWTKIKIAPALAYGKVGEEYTAPESEQRFARYQNFVDEKVQEYKTAHKNPNDLFIEGKPDYLGSKEILESKQFAPNFGEKVTPAAKIGPPKLTVETAKSLDDLKKLYGDGTIDKDRYLELGVAKGLIHRSSPTLTPPDATR